MIHNFPVPYPDELFYSVVARRDVQMRYPGYKTLLRELFGSDCKLSNLEFPSRLDYLMVRLHPGHPCSTLAGLERLTLLPWYKPFLPAERSRQIQEAMLGSGGSSCSSRAGISSSRIQPLAHLRYCPECLRADQAAGRSLYWRRLHQLPGIDVCPEHGVWLEDSPVSRSRRDYRYLLPPEELLNVAGRPVSTADDPVVGVARLGALLLAKEWPVASQAELRANYLVLLERAGYLNTRGEVRFRELLNDVTDFYPRWFLQQLGCGKRSWLVSLVRKRASIQQPVRHLLLVNFLVCGLSELFEPQVQSLPTPVTKPNLRCVNFLCEKNGQPASVFLDEQRISTLGGMVEAYRCECCGQVQGRCCVGRERTWVRDVGNLWRERLTELWGEPMSLRAIARSLRASCDAVRKRALKLGLPLVRNGKRSLSVSSYQHLIGGKQVKRERRLAKARSRWLSFKALHPDYGMRALQGKLSAEYMLLWRYDRVWLKANLPPRKPRQRAVDWSRRDQQLSQRLERAAMKLGPASPSKLARSAGITGWMNDRLDKLPKTRRTLELLCRN